MKPIHTLYLCYFGLREPLVQTQVLPYLRQLRAGGIEVSLLTFEPDPRRAWSREAIEEWRTRLQAEGIRWFSMAYHKRPSLPATGYDIVAGALAAARLVRKYQINVLHARAHIPAAMALPIKQHLGCRLIFDIRGMIADERADAGCWSRERLAYRLAKRTERALFRAADGYVVLTNRGRKELEPLLSRKRPVEVIPCCVDLSRFVAASAEFRRAARAAIGVQNRRVITYVGALGGWYLTAEMARFVATARKRDRTVFGLFVTQSDPNLIRRELQRHGVAEADVMVTSAPTGDIARLLVASDMALSFIKPCYSKRFSSPTKVAEYLAAGLPVISTPEIGDVDTLLTRREIGVLVRQHTAAEHLRAYDEMVTLMSDQGLSERCRTAAREEFDLDTVGGARYLRLYERVVLR
jgi:glycosyltransferase involved in cell wall biosynthesis